jgi:hypothetical protein
VTESDKRTNLKRYGINYRRKKFYSAGPWLSSQSCLGKGSQLGINFQGLTLSSSCTNNCVEIKSLLWVSTCQERDQHFCILGINTDTTSIIFVLESLCKFLHSSCLLHFVSMFVWFDVLMLKTQTTALFYLFTSLLQKSDHFFEKLCKFQRECFGQNFTTYAVLIDRLPV